MDKINSINALTGIFRSQLARKADKKSGTASSGGGATARSHNKPSVDQLDSLITNKIKKLNSEEEGFENKSIQIIIESILSWEFGDELLNDPDFGGLVRKITRDIDSSGELKGLYKLYCEERLKR